MNYGSKCPTLFSDRGKEAMMKSDAEYFLRRASEEAHRAIASEQPEAASAHEDLSNFYSVRAARLLAAKDEPCEG